MTVGAPAAALVALRHDPFVLLQVMTALAAGTLTEGALTTWIRERIVRLPR